MLDINVANLYQISYSTKTTFDFFLNAYSLDFLVFKKLTDQYIIINKWN